MDCEVKTIFIKISLEVGGQQMKSKETQVVHTRCRFGIALRRYTSLTMPYRRVRQCTWRHSERESNTTKARVIAD